MFAEAVSCWSNELTSSDQGSAALSSCACNCSLKDFDACTQSCIGNTCGGTIPPRKLALAIQVSSGIVSKVFHQSNALTAIFGTSSQLQAYLINNDMTICA